MLDRITRQKVMRGARTFGTNSVKDQQGMEQNALTCTE